MAQQALHPGTTQTRGRALFGLLDANGWGWASLKAAFWFILLIFLLGYIPDRAYYFTVNKTIDLGILAWSPVNFCPPGNETLPCPAPAGRGRAVGARRPPEISLPGAADRRRGRPVRDHDPVRRRLRRATRRPTRPSSRRPRGRQLRQVGQGRPDAAGSRARTPPVIYSGGKIYAIGGLGADGKPTTTVFVLTPTRRPATSASGRPPRTPSSTWPCPRPRAGAAVVAASDGLLLVGGTNGTAPVNTVCKTTFDTKTGAPGKWAPRPAQLFTPVTDASAAIVGSYLWVYGGTTADGKADATVQRGEFGTGADADERSSGSASRAAARDLPAPRTDLAGLRRERRALRGRRHRTGRRPQGTLYWAIPTNGGDIPEWKHLDVSDLPAPALAGGAPIILGPDAIIVGGTTTDGGHRGQQPREHRARGAVLPARPVRRDRPGAQDRRRDRPAARLPEREHDRHRELRDLRDHRLGVRPPRRRSRSGASGAAARRS